MPETPIAAPSTTAPVDRLALTVTAGREAAAPASPCPCLTGCMSFADEA
jgi:hypothetical protein